MRVFKGLFSITSMLIVLCGVFLLSSCTPKVQVQRLKPAEVNLSSYEKIAFGELEGRGGDKIASKLTEALVDSKYFDVVDRQHLQSILKEQNLSISEVSNPNNAVKLGKVLSGSAIVFGKVYTRDYDQGRSRDKGTCTDEDGNEYTCYTYYVTGNWNLNVSLKLVDTSTGEVLATKTFDKSAERTNYAIDERPAVTWNKTNVFGQLEDKIVKDFMHVVAPYHVAMDVYLYKDSELPQLETGIKYARQEDWQGAIELFIRAVNKAEQDPDISQELRAKAHYDLGIAYGYSGQYDKGLKQIEKAIKIKPLDTFFKQKKKIEEFRKEEKKLKEQGVDVSYLTTPTSHIITISH